MAVPAPRHSADLQYILLSTCGPWVAAPTQAVHPTAQPLVKAWLLLC